MTARALRWAGMATIALGALALSAPGTRAATNIVLNGDFESPDCGGGECNNVPPTSWANSYGNDDIVGAHDWTAEHGAQSVDLNGNQPGGLYQDLTTTAGVTYSLDFFYAGNMLNGPTVKTFNVKWNGTKQASLSFDTTNSSQGDPGWKEATFTVTASSTLTRLEFDSTTENTEFGPAIDNVSVSEQPGTNVPDAPFAPLLLVAGVSAVGAGSMLRRRRH